MDNGKTGAFIKALRTEKGMTQRELGDRLHITDRAVSKWERCLGHCGCFWYDCELVCLNGLFELDVERESDFPFSPSAPF